MKASCVIGQIRLFGSDGVFFFFFSAWVWHSRRVWKPVLIDQKDIFVLLFFCSTLSDRTKTGNTRNIMWQRFEAFVVTRSRCDPESPRRTCRGLFEQ